jgi:hypothetical protein
MISKDGINRLQIAYLLIMAELFSVVVLDLNPRDDSYYIIASTFNFAIIFILPIVVRVNLIVDFQYLNLAAFIVQGFGFFSYWYEFPVIFYNLAIHAISLAQMLRLLIIRRGDADGYCENNHWRSMVHYCHFYLSKILHKKETI